MGTTQARKTAGARDLDHYLEERGISISAFCTQNGLDRVAVQRALKGERPKRVSVDFALDIERATKGAVKIARWASETARSSRSAAA